MARVLIFSDIHNDTKSLQKLMDTEADYYFAAGDLVSWARGLDKMGEIMKPRAGQVFVLPGNHESAHDISMFCQRFGFTDFHGKSIEIDGSLVCGLGYSTTTPFDTPGEYSESEMASRLEPFRELKPHVLICHAPPLNTVLDRIKSGLHAGSKAVLEFIESVQPRHFFCGHIHEAEGKVVQMGATRCQNVGKRGYVLEL